MAWVKLQDLIDRAVGKTGIFRIQSWWMHKILSTMSDQLDNTIQINRSFSNDFSNDFTI